MQTIENGVSTRWLIGTTIAIGTIALCPPLPVEAQETVETRQRTAVQMLERLNDSQVSTYSQQGRFFRNLQMSGIPGIKQRTLDYFYQSLPFRSSVVQYAIARRPELKTVISRVMRVQSNTNGNDFRTITCMNNELGTKVPPSPQIDTQLNLVCAPGTTDVSMTADEKANEKAYWYVASINRGQQAYYLERNRFSFSFTELGMGMPDEAARHRFVLAPNAKSTLIYAIARDASTTSYVGIAVAFDAGSPMDYVTMSLICKNIQPGPIRPAAPIVKPDGTPACASGTIEFEIQTPSNNSEAKTYVGSMNRAQQAFYLENSRFATRFRDLGLGPRDTTTGFQYSIESSTEHSFQYAIARDNSLTSYVGAVIIGTASNGEMTTLAILCENDRPGILRPPAPIITPRVGMTCAPGTTPVQ